MTFQTSNQYAKVEKKKQPDAMGPHSSSPIKVPIAASYKGVSLQNTSKSHSHILKYGIYYDFMDW